MNGAMNIHGWQWMFVLEGLPSVLLGVAVLTRLHGGPDSVQWLSPIEKELVKANLVSGAVGKRHEFSAAFKDLRIWMMCAIYLAYGTGFYGLAFWLPTIIHSAGVKNSFHVGLLTAIPYAGAAIYMTWHATHARKSDERRLHTALPVLIGGIGLILSAAFSTHMVISLFFMTVAVSGLMSVMTVFWSLPSGFLSGTAVATGIAVVSSVGSLSGILGSFVSSIALDLTGDIKSGTYVLGGMMVLSGVLAFLAPRSTYGNVVHAPLAPADTELELNEVGRQ